MLIIKVILNRFLIITMIDKPIIWDSFPILETQRLILRQMKNSDTHDLLTFLGNEQVAKYTNFDPFDTPEKIQKIIQIIDGRVSTHSGIRWAIELKSEKKVIGSAGFNNWNLQGSNTSEIGYDLAPEYWNKGIMTEVVHEIMKYGFEVMKLHRIEARINPENIGSQKVVEKLGFQREGIQRGIGYWKNQYWDLCLYSKLSTD